MFQFIISDGGEAGKFTLDLKNGNGDARVGEDPKAARCLGERIRFGRLFVLYRT